MQPIVETICGPNRKNNFKEVTHCIFDLDGTLLDTEVLHKIAISNILETEFDRELSPEAYQKTIGLTSVDIWKLLINEYNLPISLEDMLLRYFERCVEIMGNCAAMPGADRLVRHLYKHNVPLAIATSCEAELLPIETQHMKDLFSLFHHTVSGASDPEVKRGKPYPDIYLICASRFEDNPNPDTCIVFEDSPSAAMGVIKAGMQCVLVVESDISQTVCRNGILILNSLKAFKPELFGLPPLSELPNTESHQHI